METIPKSDCTEIGFFRKTHGVYGELVLEFDTLFELSVEESERFFVDLEGLLVPFYIKQNGLRFKSAKSAIVALDYVDSENYAKRLVGKQVYLFNNEIIDEPEEFTESMLTGFLLIEKDLGEIGIISRVDDYSGNIVFTVQYKNEEILVPFNNDFLIEINEKNKSITLSLPDGLI